MKVSIAVVAFLIVALWGQAARARTAPPAAHDAPASKHKSPFACDRMALTPEVRKRHFEELGPILRGLRTGVRELPNGYEFQFPHDEKTFALLAEWAAQERLCCPFFDIDLRIDREDGPAWLRLTGREGTKAFIKADAPAWIRQ